MKYKDYKPNWKIAKEASDTYRAQFKWGNPSYFKEPSEDFYVFLKQKLNLTDEDFIIPQKLGEAEIKLDIPCKLQETDINEFASIVGRVNTFTDDVSRISNAFGKSVLDIIKLRNQNVDSVADVVLAPSTEEQIEMILHYCNSHKISIYPVGGKTNTSEAFDCTSGGVCLDLKRNFNKIISFNEVDQTVTVMAGISGPYLEEVLNNACDYFEHVSGRYTCGHFPQSFEFSTVGGWVQTRGRGRASTYFGGIDDILLSAKYLTPKGAIDTSTCNRASGVPCLDEIMLGSHGQYGIVTQVTLKIRRFNPDTRSGFSYLFRDFENAIRCVKEIVQRENGLPAVMRLYDANNTDIIMSMSAIFDKGLVASVLEKLGNRRGERCVLVGFTEGSKGYSKMVKRLLARTCARYGGNSTTSYVVKKWEATSYNDAYMRDVLLDYGIVNDQLDCNVSWSNLYDVVDVAKTYINGFEHVTNIMHISNMSAHGCSIHFGFLGKFLTVEEYQFFQEGLLKTLMSTKALMVKNHSVGKNFTQTVKAYMSPAHIGLFGAIKKYFDPKNILNPNKK